jgi:CRISPR-associated protein (TIGR03984 family)
MTKLYGRASANNISLSEALEKCKGELADAVAILYSPSFCKFAKFDNGNLINEKAQVIDVSTIFEARIFNPHAELRWLNVLNGQGRAVLISDEELTKIFDVEEDVSLEILDTIPQQYLLWGKGVVRSPTMPQDWSRLAAARIGALDVPIAGIEGNQHQVQLIAREYIGFCKGEPDEYGNVSVLEERLIELKLLEVKP